MRRLRSIVPEAQRDEADAIGRVFSRVVGTYFAGSLLVATIAGTWVLTVCLALGIPLAPIAAVDLTFVPEPRQAPATSRRCTTVAAMAAATAQ